MKARYHILERVAATGGAYLHRGRREDDGAAVLLKLPATENTPAQAARFRREYAMLAALDIAGVAKPAALIDEPDQLMMVFDPIEGASFDTALGGQALAVTRCLNLAPQLARILGALHAARIVHRDFRPANLMLLAQDQLCLLDLSLATTNSTAPDNTLVGDWAYISPEQTGRLNRAVDYRADLYAFGITLYRMLTGQLPCHGNDALEWAHCHLASLPRPPSEVDAAIPPVLSDIVLKLLEKMPEDRYQSAHGVQADLERCLAQRDADGAIAPFALGQHDAYEHFQIPLTLVDREPELEQLLGCHDALAASGRAALVLVSGGGGVGKSALVQALRGPIGERGGVFIAGKFDQFQREIPYSTVTQAFRVLVQNMLAESAAGVAAWRRQVEAALGANGQLIVDVLPQLELVIGPQPPLPQLPAAEAQNRFRIVFQKFVAVFAQQAHPLTLFLDNLHWADGASLRLVEDLVTAHGSSFLLVIGAYRDDEVHPGHPLAVALDAMRAGGAAITELALAPLTEQALGVFVDEILHCEPGAAAPLVRLVYRKTGGNPFFVRQFLATLAEEGLVTFDAGARRWRWDLAAIGAKGYTDNVAELMVDKLARLLPAARALLQLLACLGSDAPVATLVALSGQPEADVRAALAAAVRAGLVSRSGDVVGFLHDRVQEAAYMSMPDAARAALHARIGRRMMAEKSPAQIEEAVFVIVDQFNRGAAAIVDADERALLFRLNVQAGMKARAAVALASARCFLDRAMGLLPADPWQAQYADILELSLASCESEYLDGKVERAAELADQILAHAQSRRDSARVHLLRIALYQMAGRFDDAVASLVEGARLLDVAIPTTEPEIEAAIEAEMDGIAGLLQGRRIAGVAEARAPANADTEMALALLVEAIAPAYMVRPDYFSLIVARAVGISLRQGHTEDSCYAYSAYGILLIARRRDIATALEFSTMAVALNDNLGGRRRKGNLIATHAIAYALFSHPIAAIRPMCEQALAASLDVGDLLYANYIAMVVFWAMLQDGSPLDEVARTARANADFTRDSHNEMAFQTVRVEQQLVAAMKGLTRAPGSLDDDDFDAAACLAALEKAKFGFGLECCHVIGQISAFVYGDYAGSLASAQQASQHLHQAGALILLDSVHHFFRALAVAALYQDAPPEKQREYAGVLAEELDRHKLWADACPPNFLNRHALLGAELARVEGRTADAERLYHEAIGSASEHGFVLNAALGCELAAAFYRTRGFAFIADAHLREARAGYARWGAAGKVAQLDAAWPGLLAEARPAAAPGQDAASLDLLSIAKASQAISSQIVLADLVDTLMRIVLENAGAQTGYLLLAREDALVVAAHARIDSKRIDVKVYLEHPAAAAPLPESVINYVRRSGEQVLLADVTQPNPYSVDPYFSGRESKSVLCLPILRQDALVGLIYLESSLVTHAFTPERVAVLQLLASQAAISLQNARLYADLQEREAKIRRLFESNIVGIMYFDLDGGITEANDAALAMLGYSRQDLLDGAIHWRTMTGPEWRFADERAVAELKSTGVCRPFEKEYIRKDGGRVPVVIAAAMFEGSGEHGVAFALDLSERKQAEEQMLHMANHDALTGLPNRTLLHDRLEQAASYAHRHGGHVAILFIDLDFFKYINDSLGHQVGDAVLKMAAARLQTCLREGDSVARLGGDEFVIVLPALDGSGDVEHMARKALDALAQSYHVEGHELHITGSIGISLFPEDGADVATLMRTADTAMYHAKEMGRGNFQFFTAALNRVAQQRLAVGKRLRRALVNEEFVLHYQPQVDMKTGQILAAEALLRWQRPGSDPISCGAFIGNAEESGLIMPIGEWTLRQACRQLRAWREEGYPDLKIAVNLSPRQLEPADFCGMVGRILDEAGIPADALELEITESIFLQRSESNFATLTTLRDMGVTLAVDDFGTGYSSLAYLQRFPVHSLKIDQSFVRAIGTNRNHTALITAIIAMARGLQLEVMAEGVETFEHANFLLAHGCRLAQGYYYSKAVPAQVFSDLLRTAFTVDWRGANQAGGRKP